MQTPLVPSEQRGHGCTQYWRPDARDGSLSIRSVLGGTQDVTPMVVPTRCCLDLVKKFMRGDRYIGRGSAQRGLKRSLWANSYKVSQFTRKVAIEKYKEELVQNKDLRFQLWSLSGLRLICHCSARQTCHADAIIDAFRADFPQAYDRSDSSSLPPSGAVLDYISRLREEQDSDEDTTADEEAAPAGSGWRGSGKPMQVGTGYTSREYCDGQSLASPGRWPTDSRKYPTHALWKLVTDRYWSFCVKVGSPELLMKLALGQVQDTPFHGEDIQALKNSTVEALASHGHCMQPQPTDRPEVSIDYRFLQLLLNAAQDPEVGIGQYASGVRIGPGVRLPRLPALYKRKKKWRLPEQADPLDYMDEEQSGESPWRANYSTLAALADKVTEVLDDQAERGQVLKLSEAEARSLYPKLVVASLGANRKDKPNGVVTARVLFDGTNGIHVNKRTRIRDQERSPIAADLKRAMREKARVGERTFALTADVSEAHRQVPIAECDWWMQGCQVQPGSSVYVNKVGTFDVASASYYWSRVASALGRLAQYLSGEQAHTWHMLVADDFHLEASGSGYRPALFAFFVLCATCNVPLSWNKTAGGDTVAWVGFELLHRSHQLGISQRRAEWFIRWSRGVASSEFVKMSTFEEGLGRIAYVAGALENERPFLGPLYRFLTLHPRQSVRRVPSYVAFILNHLSGQLERSRHYPCAVNQLSSDVSPRVDAQASDERTGIGGWYPVLDKRGVPDTWASPWFSMLVEREHLPWVFEKGDKPALVISTLEALAVLVSLKSVLRF